jgi:hypothetical protein
MASNPLRNKRQANLKQCTKCNKLKLQSEFYKVSSKEPIPRGDCIECVKTRISLHSRKPETKKRLKEYNQAYRKVWRQKPHVKKKEKEYRERTAICRRAKQREEYQKPDVKERKRVTSKRRWANDGRFRLTRNFANGVWRALQENKNGRHWEELVGYTLNELKSHIERLFLPGMTWENYGNRGWHIDHIIPVRVFNFGHPDEIDFRKCWELKNLRPLWKDENMRKNGRLSKPFQPSLRLKDGKQ